MKEKLQKPNTKLQRIPNLQAPTVTKDFICLAVWSFSGAWRLVLGISAFTLATLT
jgi:hypothetical protein